MNDILVRMEPRGQVLKGDDGRGDRNGVMSAVKCEDGSRDIQGRH